MIFSIEIHFAAIIFLIITYEPQRGLLKMFIRESKTKNKKTQKVYIKHTLVESVRTEQGPRQRVVMNLGELELDRSLWKELANGIEAYLLKSESVENISLFDLPSDLLGELERQRAIIRHNNNQQAVEQDSSVSEPDIQQVDIKTLTVEDTRSLGPELVAFETWKRLGFEDILTDCGFNKREIALAASVIWGRLICPGSDLNTWRWLRNTSSLPDFFEANISKVHKDKIYEIADKLLEHKDVLEKTLYENQSKQFELGQTLFLFDLTNFYFEGKCKGNNLAKRGKSKEKRSQNVLVSLALIVDQHGFPVRSLVYRGNIGEPETLEAILKKCGFMDDADGALPFRPILAMDRGIATQDNVKFIKDNHFPYTVIQRANEAKKFIEEFGTMEGFTSIRDSKGQVIKLKKIGDQLLCRSESRCDKEQAMFEKRIAIITKELEAIKKSVEKGTLKKEKKVYERIGRIKGKRPGFDSLFEVDFDEKTQKFTYSQKNSEDPLAGCYVIEYDGIDGNEEIIWRTYTTLTKVEGAFRSMKTDLGTRPVYHQGAQRTEAHLFLSILAYHMLVNVEYRLREAGAPAHWHTIREQLRTHSRCTITWKDADGESCNKKVSSKPEPTHCQTYRKLNIRNPLKDYVF